MPAGSRGWRARRGEGASPASGRSERPLCRQPPHGSHHPPHGVKHLEVAYGRNPAYGHWRLELPSPVREFGRHWHEATQEDAFEELLPLHRLRDEAQPHRGTLERRDDVVSGRPHCHREPREKLTREPFLLEQSAKLSGAEVADTERARIELSPVSVHRTDKEDSVGSEHAAGLINKSAGVLQIVDRLVEEDYIEAPLRSEERRVGKECSTEWYRRQYEENTS